MKKTLLNITFVVAGTALISSCTTDPASPGVEYMPDMYRSPSVEAYVDYGEVRNVENVKYKNALSAKIPPKYTIPYKANQETAEYNMPFPFKAPFNADKTHNIKAWDMYKTDEAATAAFENEIKTYPNPIPFSEQSFEEGKELYSVMCAVCHGAEGKGDGKVGTKLGATDLTTGPIQAYTDGQIFYRITYGKGNMGPYGMLMTREERWKTVQYVKALQNDKKYPAHGGLNMNMEADSTGKFMPFTLNEIQYISNTGQMHVRKSRGQLTKIISMLRINPEIKLKIRNYTNNSTELAGKRAGTVKDYLVRYGEIESDRIIVEGKTNTETAGERTEIVIVR